MTARPGVTVVVPTHHRPLLVSRAVESVLAQEYAGVVEVVVVFDACEPFDLPVRVPPGRVVRTTANMRRRGLAGARNTGIVLATHELVAFLDDDDVWLPGKLDAQVDLLDAHPSAVLAGCGIVVDDGRHTHERLVPLAEVRHADLLRDSFAGLHPSTFLFLTEALRGSVGLVDEEVPGSYGEDYDLVLRTALVAPIVVVDRALVSVTWGGSHFFGRWAAYADGLEYLLAKHPGFRADRRALGRIAGQVAFSRAAAGERRAGLRWAWTSLSHDPTEPRSWLAVAVALRLLSAPWVVRVVQRLGRGI